MCDRGLLVYSKSSEGKHQLKRDLGTVKNSKKQQQTDKLEKLAWLRKVVGELCDSLLTRAQRLPFGLSKLYTPDGAIKFSDDADYGG